MISKNVQEMIPKIQQIFLKNKNDSGNKVRFYLPYCR